LSNPPLLWAVLREPANLRFVVPILTELHRRGWDIAISFALPDRIDLDVRPIEWARSELPGARFEPFMLSAIAPGVRERALVAFRDLDSYLQQAPTWPSILKERWPDYLIRPLAALVRASHRAGRPWLVDNALLRAASSLVRRAAPYPKVLQAQLEELQPDRVLVSPMLYPASREIDVVAVARRNGIPTFGLVLSWDNLSSKGRFHDLPDRLMVWNEMQRREAENLHSIGRARIKIVGAPVFDFLFEPRSGDAARIRRKPYVLYAVSSKLALGPAGEVNIVRRLSAALRDRLGLAAPDILVRPHPKNRLGWGRASALAGVEIVNDAGFPESHTARKAFRDCLADAVAVIGLNTSMFIDASIVGTPCFALVGSEENQLVAGTLAHFAMLRKAAFLYEAVDEAEVACGVARLIEEGDDERRAAARERFVQSFVRPLGVGRAAAAAAADAIEGH
jgi:hypothetical protein